MVEGLKANALRFKSNFLRIYGYYVIQFSFINDISKIGLIHNFALNNQFFTILMT
ncbi:MAG: hypothetical protein PHD05_10065 [Sphaerochaetaceae bacterium]|nr:hypothetical protein [Sphaerochaetaceae bacterium]